MYFFNTFFDDSKNWFLLYIYIDKHISFLSLKYNIDKSIDIRILFIYSLRCRFV